MSIHNEAFIPIGEALVKLAEFLRDGLADAIDRGDLCECYRCGAPMDGDNLAVIACSNKGMDTARFLLMCRCCCKRTEDDDHDTWLNQRFMLDSPRGNA